MYYQLNGLKEGWCCFEWNNERWRKFVNLHLFPTHCLLRILRDCHSHKFCIKKIYIVLYLRYRKHQTISYTYFHVFPFLRWNILISENVHINGIMSVDIQSFPDSEYYMKKAQKNSLSSLGLKICLHRGKQSGINTQDIGVVTRFLRSFLSHTCLLFFPPATLCTFLPACHRGQDGSAA